MDFILMSLDTTRVALLPQIRILENHHLITGADDTYELTNIGKLIVDEMSPLLDIVDIFDSNIDFWGTHDLGFIPPHLLRRIGELAPYTLAESIPLTEMSEPNKTVLQKAKISNYQTSVTGFLFPTFPSVLAEFRKNGVNFSMVISSELLSKIRAEANDDFRNLLNSDLNKIYLCPEEMGFISFGYNEYFFMIRFLTKNGDYDHNYLVSSSPSALEWGKELFDYYLKNAVPIDIMW
ncbi:winged helix-turn-helix domain-containing protein [uncultured Methanolobus sp.]|uniref:helix-turn-helix transcriptional regulator n=1 Tax=uncultured Methanolobus sp. TaxID=218300 RepID=UPI0029C60EBA|nr:winged helix-turn-helix domain-containing protein [uncultured Methanolobus sp.]